RCSSSNWRRYGPTRRCFAMWTSSSGGGPLTGSLRTSPTSVTLACWSAPSRHDSPRVVAVRPEFGDLGRAVPVHQSRGRRRRAAGIHRLGAGRAHRRAAARTPPARTRNRARRGRRAARCRRRRSPRRAARRRSDSGGDAGVRRGADHREPSIGRSRPARAGGRESDHLGGRAAPGSLGAAAPGDPRVRALGHRRARRGLHRAGAGRILSAHRGSRTEPGPRHHLHQSPGGCTARRRGARRASRSHVRRGPGAHSGRLVARDAPFTLVYGTGGSTMTAPSITAKWSTRAPYLLSVLRIVAAFLFMQFGTAKLFAFPAAIMPGGGTAAIGSLPGIAGILETFGGLFLLLRLFPRPVAF